MHGWNFVNNDARLDYTGPQEDNHCYYRGHHVFVAGEIAAMAPACPVMILTWGWRRPDSLAEAIRYAVEHGARILVMPHGYLTGNLRDGTALFYRGTDFSYPDDNHDLRRALDEAYDAGCLIFQGTADNRGRRVACYSGFEAVVAVGSSNRAGEAADICCSADYVEIGAPGGERGSENPYDRIWGYGGDRNLIPFTGGCMACGFAGAVAGLVWSRFPALTNEQVRQVLRNTAQGEGWNPKLGWGILDAARAVALKQEQLTPVLRIKTRQGARITRRGKPLLKIVLANRGALDVRRAVVAVYNGDPSKPAAPEGTMEKPVILKISQVGHAIASVRGLHDTEFRVVLAERPAGVRVWLEAYSLDRHGPETVARATVKIT